ncbi:amidase [Rhodoplanes roseus]|uniref:Amidase n=1 Tax=Rhodoplanes roseus TaxID=29409 RepID=A0A327KXF9_9BRAD|nr:amidase [Rhodoplanes roseus]RAI42215.1 amidase [Rhodoplanes roseus]
MTDAAALADPHNAFCHDVTVRLDGKPGGPLTGLTFGAKDLFHVKGVRTGGGNFDWRDTHPPAEETAWAIETLVAAGATMVGKTITDEISRGIFGESAFYGTPTNPRAPGRIPGGSSSGSAAAVAGGTVPFAIGTDTAGSVRVPSSFCGLFGIRTTHGRVPVAGMLPQAPSFDTVGWMADDAEVFARVSAVLLESSIEAVRPKRIFLADDAFAVAEPDTAAAVEAALMRAFGDGTAIERVRLSPTGLSDWSSHQAMLQGREAWTTFGEWIDSTNPRFSFEVADNFLRGTRASPEELSMARETREQVRERVHTLLADGSLIALPTTPFPAPPAGQKRSTMWGLRAGIIALTAVSGMAGTPQVTMPFAAVDGLPVGLSLIGAPGADERLIGAALDAARRGVRV